MSTGFGKNIAIGVMLLLTACGSGPTGGAPASAVDIVLKTDPSPVTIGDTEVILLITDANGTPVEGATVDVSAEHTGHSGMSMSGLAVEQGDGRYAINADFSMTGSWKLTVYVRKDGLDYKEQIELPVR